MIKMNILQVRRSKATAQANYDRMSTWYDWLVGSSERPFREAGLNLLHILPGESVLEIGCGSGQALEVLAREVGISGWIAGIDISPGMLRVARAKVQGAKLVNIPSLLLADGEWLPLMSGLYDAVFMSFTLELFDTMEIPLVLAECWRVLKPGGRISVVAMARQPGNWTVKLYEWLHRRFPALLDCRPIYAVDSLELGGFEIQQRIVLRMWGLPVEIVLGKKTGKTEAAT